MAAATDAWSFSGGTSCTLSEVSSGVASCSASYIPSATPETPVRSDTITAEYAGDSTHLTSNGSTTVQVLSITVLAGGSFVIGEGQSQVGDSVTLWNWLWPLWQKLHGGGISWPVWPVDFHGFAASIPNNPPKCGDNWTSGLQSSLAAVPPVMPELIAVIVTNSMTANAGTYTASQFHGNTVKVDVVKTNPGYSPSFLGEGTGTVVAQVCP